MFGRERAVAGKLLPLIPAMGVFLFAPLFSFAAGATLSLTPATGGFVKGEEFTVKILLDPAGAKVNVADALVKFDKDVVSVVSLSKAVSAFSLWTTEPEFSNSKGTISFAGGATTPFTAKSTLLTIIFKGIKTTSSTTVSFEDGSVLAADGKGTDVLETKTSAVYEIKEKIAATEVPKPTYTGPPPVGDTPTAPTITSSTHIKSDQWYSTTTVIFSWDVPYDVTSVRVVMGKDKDVAPNVVYTPPVTTRTIKDAEEGELYFRVQFKNQYGWGEVGTKKIMIDASPPDDFEIKLLTEGTYANSPSLSFATKDTYSGIDRYELKIGDEILKTLYPDDLAGGIFKIPVQSGGQKNVNVKVLDKAGNHLEKSADLNIPAVVAASAAANNGNGEETAPPVFWSLERILLVALFFVTGIIFALYFVQKIHVAKERSLAVREISSLRDKAGQIFSALREEAEEQVQGLDNKPQLSADERQLVENLKEVMDLSEEILDSEIDNLRRTIS